MVVNFTYATRHSNDKDKETSRKTRIASHTKGRCKYTKTEIWKRVSQSRTCQKSSILKTATGNTVKSKISIFEHLQIIALAIAQGRTCYIDSSESRTNNNK